MPAKRYLSGLSKFAALQSRRRKGVRLPETPPGTGLPAKVVRSLRDFRPYKRGKGKEIGWRVPGYEVLCQAGRSRR